MRGPGFATAVRRATPGETAAFQARLEAILDSMRAQLVKLASGEYETKVVTIAACEVRAHTRKIFKKVYLAKKRPEKEELVRSVKKQAPIGQLGLNRRALQSKRKPSSSMPKVL